MTSSDDLSLPQDPGPVPASLRDAYTSTAASRRASAPAPVPGASDLERLLDDTQDDQARLAVVDQLLGSGEGVETLSHLVAARVSTTVDAVGDDVRADTVARPAMRPANSRHGLPATLKPILLAASLMMVAGTSWYVFTLPPRGDADRALGSAVELYEAPVPQSTGAVTLAWKPLRATSRYRVEVLDANDDPVFATETNDTAAVVPPGALAAGTYRWWVRSKAMDGTEIRSRVVKLIVR